MTTFVFHYFNGKGLGEPCRLLLVYEGQQFDDRRIQPEEWPAYKPKMLYGQVLILEIDGKQYVQSLAISRYLGHKYGLVGDTPEDALEIDQNVNLINDFQAKASEVAYEKDEAVKKAKYANYAQNVFPEYLERLNAVMETAPRATVTSRSARIMTNYVFYYFDVKGLGEVCRLLLAYGGEKFDDRRIQKEDWPAFKPKTPFGQLPMLEVDGKKYSQSIAISRYLGRKYGLVGDTPEDALEIDQNVDLLNDCRAKMMEIAYEKDEVTKEAKFVNYSKNVFPEYLEKLSAVIEKNNGYLALGKLTWGDFVLAGIFEALQMMLREPEIAKKYPAFQKVLDHVYSVPKVKAYSESKK